MNVVQAVLLSVLFATGAAGAQDADAIFLNATYSDAPNDWCSESRGLAVVVEMDGPDIIVGPRDLPKPVRERVGGKLRVMPDGKQIAFNGGSADVDFSVIGRFSAKFGGCASLTLERIMQGNWHITGNDGLEVDAGTIKDMVVMSSNSRPFFRPLPGTSTVHLLQLGDRIVFTAELPKSNTTHNFPFDRDKE